MISPSAAKGLAQLGSDLKSARLKRRIALRDFAERVGVSQRTISRLEKGDEGVGVGTLAMACLVLGELDRLAALFDPGTDSAGLLLERDALPKRIVRKRGHASSTLPPSGVERPATDDEDGVGF